MPDPSGRLNLTVNPEAERALLACLIRNPDAATIIDNRINADHFSVAANRQAFAAIAAYLAEGTPPDAATLRAVLDGRTLIEVETSLSEHASSANAHVYASLLRDAKRAREEQQARDWLKQAVAKGRPPHELRAIVEGMEQAMLGDAGKSRFASIADLCASPPSENSLVKGFIPLDALTGYFGSAGDGKSFVLIDIGGHVATGRDWRGFPVKQGLVLYIAGEGKNGLSRRFKAWFQRHGETPRNIQICTTPIALTDGASMAALVAEIRAMPEPPVLIVIDTLNRNFGPGDENSTADMTKAVAGLDALRVATGAAVVAVHHSGHSNKDRSRGNSVLNASLDMEFAVEKVERTVQIRCTKAKDQDVSPPLAWTLERQALPWADQDGNPLDSAVLVPVETDAFPIRKPALPRPARVALESLKTSCETSPDGYTFLADWRKAALAAGISDAETKQGRHVAFTRAKEILENAQLICSEGEKWQPKS